MTILPSVSMALGAALALTFAACGGGAAGGEAAGGGSGVKSVIDRTVDFGASDAAMRPEDMAKVDGGLRLFPMTAGSIPLACNVNEMSPSVCG